MAAPYFYMPMPVNENGDGPAREDEAVSVLHEVWNSDCEKICTCAEEEMARWVADTLNSSALEIQRRESA